MITAAPLIPALAGGPTPALADQLLLTDKAAPDVPPFKGGTGEAKERFVAAMREIDSLLANYDEITKGANGDNVRCDEELSVARLAGGQKVTHLVSTFKHADFTSERRE